MLINSGLFYNFWAETKETINYFCNRLSNRNKNYSKIIFKEAQTSQHQNLQHIHLFSSLTLSNISKENKSNSDYQKIWQGILIGYNPNTIKYFRVSAPQIKQVIIISKPYIDELGKGIKLLSNHSLKEHTLLKKKHQLANYNLEVDYKKT